MSGAEQTGEEMPTSFSSPAANWRAHQRAGSICAGCHCPANKQQTGPVVGVFSSVLVAAFALPLSRAEP
jgi:hypothetical protein